MSKRKVVKNIHLSQDYLLDCLENNIIMGEAQWLTNEETHILERKYNMNYDPSELPKFQSCLDEAASIVFGRATDVTGIRFMKNDIAVTITFNETEDVILLPYDCITGTTAHIVECIHQVQTEREKEIEKKEELRKGYEEKHERDIYERLRKKFEKVD